MMTTTSSKVWAARAAVTAASKAWKESGTPVGSDLHAAYMAAKQALEAVKAETPAAVAVAAPSYPRCCERGVVTFGGHWSHSVTCPEHGTRHHGTAD